MCTKPPQNLGCMCVVGLLGGLGLCLIVVVAGVDVLVCGSFLLPASTTTNKKTKVMQEVH